ncbi:MAG: asparagine synthase (glutamine-hydrolyzing) [Thermoleophilaceae bacterium]|nr:asparagine synthase (glutamine-hydrolyzing) [Thermoleophilaceae bacterium]
MCGIAAQYAASDEAAGQRMLDRLAHRGPDDFGSAEVGGSWLGHRRLSIVDVDGGAQPMRGERLVLAGNGEVYNHETVRGALADRSFSTNSDNEVALHLLEEEDPDALCALEGMFAFVAAGEGGYFVAARDPVGIKPLYWARRGNDVRFASEMRAFDTEWLPAVRPFPPGYHWTPLRGLVRFSRAAPMAAPEPAGDPLADPPAHAVEQVRDELVCSVERQMMGDVPVGVFLSGGLDSSLIAAIAARLLPEGERLPTFAVGTEGSPDLEAARQVARYLGTDHHERVYDAEEAVGALPEVVRAIESFDPSLVRSAVPNYLLAEMTAEHVKVVLTGEGADELFAGYEYLRDLEAEPLHAELVRTVEGLHNLNLQRCDRVTMAHGLEARVPFLDTQVIAFALGLPAEWKLSGPEKPEKLLLRRAFEGWLPDEFLWRDKAQFGDGSGAATVLQDRFADSVSEPELVAERSEAEPSIRTREELAYWRIFRKALQGVRTEETVGRFATA